MTAPSHVYSYGGGVQSTAMLVLAAQGYLPAGPFLFANVGDDSEHPGTVEYVRNVAFEYAARHGLDVHELERAPGDTIWGRIMAPGSYDVPIPMRGSDTGAPGARSCTANYKIDVVSRWVRDAGATPDQPVHVGIGISTDEIERANAAKRSNDREQAWYPLLTLEHRLAPRGANRDQCAAIIADAGLPVPPKSSCYFCPFHKPTTWNDMARDEPDLFERAALLEDTVNERRAARPCPGSGAWPHEATQGLDRDAMGDPNADDYQPPAIATYRSDWQPLDGAGGCPSCRSRHAVVLDAASQWRLVDHTRGPVYLTRFGQPLRRLFAHPQLSLLDASDDGYRCGDVCDT